MGKLEDDHPLKDAANQSVFGGRTTLCSVRESQMMKTSLRRTIVACAAALEIACAAYSEQAAAQAAANHPVVPTSAQARLMQVIAGMGYTPTLHSSVVSFQTPRPYVHEIYLSDDGSVYNIIPLTIIPGGKTAKVPYQQILEWGATHDSYFTRVKSTATPPIVQFELNQACGSGPPNAAMLVKCSSALEQDADNSVTLWDVAHWK
jgi:hypothetical protein